MKFYRVVLYKYSQNGAELQHFAFNATKGRFVIKIAYCVLKHTQEIHRVAIFVIKDNQPTDKQLVFGITDIKNGKLAMLQALQKFEYGKEEEPCPNWESGIRCDCSYCYKQIHYGKGEA